jgi:hypothetical protein
VVLPLGFAKYVIEPLYVILNAIETQNRDSLRKICTAINVNFDEIDFESSSRMQFNTVMQKWLPLRMILSFSSCDSC